MAGLIRNEMAGQKPAAAPMAPEQPMQGQMPAGQEDQGGEEVDERNPEFISAMKFALKVLYQSGAADDIAKQLRASKTSKKAWPTSPTRSSAWWTSARMARFHAS